jgi:hypothetical protein
VFLSIDYHYNRKTISEDQVDFILEKSIESYLKSITSEEFSFELMLPFMTKLHFEKVDKKIEKFGEKWGNYLKSTYPKLDDLEFSALCDLLLNNVSFFHQKVFPNVDLQGIENPLQVSALLEGKYFRFLSTNNFFRDLDFRFE